MGEQVERLMAERDDARREVEACHAIMHHIRKMCGAEHGMTIQAVDRVVVELADARVEVGRLTAELAHEREAHDADHLRATRNWEQARDALALATAAEAARAEADRQLAAERERTARIAGTVTKMVNYRRRNVHNFQMEKFDDFIHALEREVFADDAVLAAQPAANGETK